MYLIFIGNAFTFSFFFQGIEDKSSFVLSQFLNNSINIFGIYTFVNKEQISLL